MRAVVFAYHNVGVRCLQVLLAKGIEIPLVITHCIDPHETIWFASVAALCEEHQIAYVTPIDANDPELIEAIKAAQPDIIFSFYYRHMLPPALLSIAPMGAYNMHGSLLPKYRGRVPINWAVLHGETETGATLHQMEVKPDAGAIVAQTAVPILPDDTAYDVFNKVVVAAEQTLWRVLPSIIQAQIPSLPNPIAQGSYFGGRKPEDGCINWLAPAHQVYNLIRAVAPPYPGAWTVIGGQRLIISKARLARAEHKTSMRVQAMQVSLVPAVQKGLAKCGLAVVDQKIIGLCGDGGIVLVHELLLDGTAVTAPALHSLLLESSHSQSVT
jgi:methionyl-tRNA formyltransferase